MKLDNLKEVLKNESKYRLKQANEAIFKSLIDDWSSASYLPPKLRETLNKECNLDVKGEVIGSDESALKAIITLDDGLMIESVLMRHTGGRSTVCVSSQVGCPMKCGFCATGAMGFSRNLTKDEIVGQVLFFARYLKKRGNENITNIVFMGMGEPFLNYDNVLSAIRILNDKEGLNIGARKISISTSGVIDGINKLAEENLQVNLAISLHASYDELRSRLMPVNIKYSLEEVLSAVDSYIKKTSRQVMFEYIMLSGINDSKEDAKKLAKIMKKPLYFVNLIVYNPTGKEGMEPSSHNSVRKFKEILDKAGAHVSERYRFGGEINAACGQLATGNRL